MNEPPGARLRVGLSGLTMAEYFRDQGQDVLLFIDNIFRFVQAGSEVSALLGRMPSAVGYQPTLATEMGQLQERITSTRQGSVTSIQAIYVPADDLPTRRRPTRSPTSTRHRRSREPIVEQGIYPAIDPLDSVSRALQPGIVSDEHYDTATRVQEILQRYKDLQDIIAILGIDELSDEDKVTVGRARARSSASSRSRTSWPSSSPARPGRYVKLEDTIAGFREIIEGKHDDLPEQAFYMVGDDRRGRREGPAARAARTSRGGRRRARGRARARSGSRADAALAEKHLVQRLPRHARGPGLRGRGGDARRPGRGRRDRRARPPRAARRDAQRGRARASTRDRDSEDSLEFATGPGFFKVEQDRALALVDDAVEAREIDEERAREQLERARAELERVESGESDADRWQLEQRIVHAENQLTVLGRG